MAQDVRISWNPPLIDQIGVQILKYRIYHNFPIADSSGRNVRAGRDSNVLMLPPNSTETTFKSVENGEYYFAITVIYNTKQNNYSLPYIEYFSISEDTEIGTSGHVVAPLYVAKGGLSNVDFSIVSQGNNTYVMPSDHKWSIKGPHDLPSRVSSSSANVNTIRQNVTNMENSSGPIDFSTSNYNDFNPEYSYILLDVSDVNDPFKLIRYSDEQGVPYWYDTGSGQKTSITGTTSSFVTALSGTISVTPGSNIVRGHNGTEFNDELRNGDTLFYTDSQSAQVVGTVANIVSDRKLKLKEAYPGALRRDRRIYGRSNLRLQIQKDTLVGAVAKYNNEYAVENYLTVEMESAPVNSTSSKVLVQWTFDSLSNGGYQIPSVDRSPNRRAFFSAGSGTITSDSPSGNALELSTPASVKLTKDRDSYNWTQNGACFSIWIKSTVNDGSGNSAARILSRDNASNSFMSLRIDQSTIDKQAVSLIDENTGNTLLIGDIDATLWTNIALASDKNTSGDYNYGLYINGKLVDAFNSTGTYAFRPFGAESSLPASSSDVTPLILGSSNISASDPFKGIITDLILFDERLSGAEVRGVYGISGVSVPSNISRPVSIGSGDHSITFDSDGLTVGGDTKESAPFSVSITGSVIAAAGQIASWTISSSSLHAGERTDSGYANSGITLHASGSMHSPEFYMDSTGAFFRGEITASSGNIGGWNLSENSIYAGLTENYATNFVPSFFTDQNGILLHKQGSIHSKNFYINSDGSSSFTGDISGATGTFNGKVLPQSITATSIEDGSITKDEIGSGTIESHNINRTSSVRFYDEKPNGSILKSAFVTLDGTDKEYAMYAGDYTSGSAPFKVTNDGKLIAEQVEIFDSERQEMFNSTIGFTGNAIRQLNKDLGTRTAALSFPLTDFLDASDSTTYAEVRLTQPTNVTTSIKVPIRHCAYTAFKEHFGNINNPNSINVDIATIAASGTTNLSRSGDIKKPGGAGLDRPLQNGEIVRLNLKNTRADMALKTVNNAVNPISGCSFSLPIALDSVSSSFVTFKIDGLSAFGFTISSKNTSNLVMTADENSVVTPDTTTIARNKTPSQMSTEVLVTAGDLTGTNCAVLASKAITRTYSDTPSASEFQIKTLAQNVLTASSIYSTVGIVTGGAVNAQGYITRSSITASRAGGKHFYHATMSSVGATDALDGTVMTLDVSIPDNISTPRFATLPSGAITQSALDTSIQSLTVTGDMTVPSDFTVNTPGTVTIDGDFVVTGTQTVTTQADLTVSSKLVTVSQNAATAAQVHESGLAVDRTKIGQDDATVLWDQNNGSWKLYQSVSSSSLNLLTNGTSNDLAIKFSNKLNTGIFASSSSSGGDTLRIQTPAADNTVYSTEISSDWIKSPKHVLTGGSGVFSNTGDDDTVLGVLTNDRNIQIADASDNVIVQVTASSQRVGIGTGGEAPPVKLHIADGDSGRTPTSTGKGLFLESDDHTYLSIGAPANKDSAVWFSSSYNTKDGGIRYDETYRTMTCYAGGLIRLALDNANANYFTDSTGVRGSELSGVGSTTGILDLWCTKATPHAGISGSLLTFSGFATDNSTTRVVRGGICSGPSAYGQGYGYMDLLLANSSAEISSTVATKQVRFARTGELGPHASFGSHNNAAKEVFEIYAQEFNSQAKDSFILLTKPSQANVGRKAGLKIAMESASVMIAAERAASDDGTTDLLFTTHGNSSPVEAMRILGLNQRVGIQRSDPRADLHVKHMGLHSFTLSGANSAVPYGIASFNLSDFASVKFMVQMEDRGNSNCMACEIMLVVDRIDSSVAMTEYAVVHTGTTKGVSFSAPISQGSVVLTATPDAVSTNRTFTVGMIGISMNTT